MNGIAKPSLKWRLARISFWLNRFSALPRVDRLFRKTAERTILERGLFGYSFLCDVSKAGPPRLIYVDGERFLPESNLILSLLRPGDRVVDVGANIGYYCLMFRKGIGPEGRIVAIEPSPENLADLRWNLEYNKLSHQVEIIECAVGDRTDIVGLQSGLNSGVVSDDIAPYRVSIDTLDNIVVGPVDFVKMDIEGYEIFALKGAKRLLERCPKFFLEIHPWHLRSFGSTAAEVFELLKQIYPDISIYIQGSGGGFLRKLLRYYFGVGLMQEIKDHTSFISRISYDDTALPFWAVCRSQRAAE